MKKILGAMRRCCEDFDMISAGDKIAVGVSGGKDSLMLLYALSLYKLYMKIPFELEALTLGVGLEEADYSGVEALCEKLEVPFTLKRTDISDILFNQRHEKNPCALCAKMRRGALNELAAEHGCNKVALGHHRDDAIETFLLSLFYEGRINTFQPSTYLSRSKLTVIRPMLYISESYIAGLAARLRLPIVESSCPANGYTKRQEMKELLNRISEKIPHARQYMLHALQDGSQYNLWHMPAGPTHAPSEADE